MLKLTSFFDQAYRTPEWFNKKASSRRALLKGGLKAAGGASIIAALPRQVVAENELALAAQVQLDPWLTLNAVFNHLLPQSPSGPSAEEINALTYLYNVVHLQPTDQSEIAFIYQGVGWLNGYSQTQYQQNFVALSEQNKESLLRDISRSKAGENWLNTLLGYLMEAILTPPVYGGNTEQKGWQWLEHSGGFPLPNKGTRFYEIPNQQTPFSQINISKKGSKT